MHFSQTSDANFDVIFSDVKIESIKMIKQQKNRKGEIWKKNATFRPASPLKLRFGMETSLDCLIAKAANPAITEEDI